MSAPALRLSFGGVRDHEDLRLRENFIQSLDILFSELEPQGVLAPTSMAAFNSIRDAIKRLADTACLLKNLRGLTLALKDRCLLNTLCYVYLRFTLTLGI